MNLKCRSSHIMSGKSSMRMNRFTVEKAVWTHSISMLQDIHGNWDSSCGPFSITLAVTV